MSSRRKLLAAASAAVLVGARGLLAQTTKIYRVGFLGFSSSGFASRFEAFRAGMRELGYVEGKNLVIEQRWAEGRYELYPELAADLVKSKVDVIVTHGTPGGLVAKRATSTIPIVMAQGGDAVAAGIVASLANPGGNITGLTQLSSEMYTKRLELLRDVVPTATRIALLYNPSNPVYRTVTKQVEGAAVRMKLTLHPMEVRGPQDLEQVFAEIAKQAIGGVVVADDAALTSSARSIAGLATRYRLASIGSLEFVDAGGLMAHSANFREMFRRAAVFTDKILKGAKPANLPIEQPTTFETVINLGAAKAIGLTFPPKILLRADRVLE